MGTAPRDAADCGSQSEANRLDWNLAPNFQLLNLLQTAMPCIAVLVPFRPPCMYCLETKRTFAWVYDGTHRKDRLDNPFAG